MHQTFFHNFLCSRKYDLIHLTSYHGQPCILQFCDITKGITLQKFSRTKKRDIPTGSSEYAISKSENLVTATGTFRPGLPVLINSRPFVMSQNCEMLGCEWYGVKRIKSIFANKGIVEKGLGHLNQF